MSKTGLTYQRIIGYLKGILSNRERHELEKEVMQDAFEEEAFEGLNLLTADELESDMQRMETMLERRTQKRERNLGPVLFRIAATILLLIGMGTVLYYALFNRENIPDTGYIAESREAVQPADEKGGGDIAAREEDSSVHESAPYIQSVMPEERPLTEASRQAAQPVQPVQPVPELQPAQPVQPAPSLPEETFAYDELADTQAMVAERQRYAMAPDRVSTEAPQQKSMAAPGIVSESAAMAGEKEDMVAKSSSEEEPGQLLSPINSFTARMVDQSGKAVSGVAVYEKNVIPGTVTDRDGIFSLEMTRPASQLALSSLAFRETDLIEDDLAAGDLAESDLAKRDLTAGEMFQEDDILSLKEVVVTGYMSENATQISNESAGPVSYISQNPDQPATFEVVSPVPPGGTLRAYKRLVEENLDKGNLAASIEQMEDISGSYWIDVTMTIRVDGSVDDILFDNDIPQVVMDAYQASIQSLPSWQPALQGNTLVESMVEMRFVLSIE